MIRVSKELGARSISIIKDENLWQYLLKHLKCFESKMNVQKKDGESSAASDTVKNIKFI